MYKLRNGVELPKEFKIKVNPEQSEALQLYLLSIGVLSITCTGNETAYFDMPFFYCRISFDVRRMAADYYNESSEQRFKNHRLPQIKFKDYFEKVTNQFPEKWCIEVTQDNYKELNVWMHRNWKNYEGYTDKWKVSPTHAKVFYSHGKDVCNKGHKDVFYELITTEQFRKQFGFLTETKLQGTKAGKKEILSQDQIEAIEHNLEHWKKMAKYHRDRCKDLRLERYKLSKELETYKSVIRKIESNLKHMNIPF